MAGKRRSNDATVVNTLNIKTGCILSTWDGSDGSCHWCSAILVGRQRSWCGKACRRKFERNHVWSIARTAAKRSAGRKCVTCGSNDKLEVNHVIPVLGAGYGLSCRHHADNLETLCHNCHVTVTNQQREERKAA